MISLGLLRISSRVTRKLTVKSNRLRCIAPFFKTTSGFKVHSSLVHYSTNSNVVLGQPFEENPFENDLLGYHVAVKKAMNDLIEQCEDLDILSEIEDFDLNEKDGVFTMKLGSKGTYVINKQTPTRQLWYSSPVSGPKRFNYDTQTKVWRNNKDSKDMYEQLSEEISSLLNIEWNMYKKK